MNDADDPVEEVDEDLEESLRSYIKESIIGVHYGFRRGNLSDIKDSFPFLFRFLVSNYGDFLRGCVVALRGNDRVKKPVPYVLLPDQKMTVVTVSSDGRRPVYAQGEDIARAVERIK